MRTRFLPAAVSLGLGLWGLGGLMATSGCDDITTGTLGEESGAPMLWRVMVQDARPLGRRGLATDLYDDSMGRACDDLHPCDAPIACIGATATPLSGSCQSSTNVNYNPPQVGLLDLPTAASSGSPGAVAIRLVSSKALDPGFEVVKVQDPQDNSKTLYTVPAGLIGLKCAGLTINPVVDSGTKAVTGIYYDPTGSPGLGDRGFGVGATDTSNPIIAPYGPALVFVTADLLPSGATCTITFDSTRLLDKKKQAMIDGHRACVTKNTADPDTHLVIETCTPAQKPFDNPAAVAINFKTESLFVYTAASCPNQGSDSICGASNFPSVEDPKVVARVAPNDAFQLLLNNRFDEKSFDPARLTLKDKDKNNVAIEVFQTRDVGMKGSRCKVKTANTGIDQTALNIVPVSVPGKPMNLAPGNYTLTLGGLKDLRPDGTPGMATLDPLTVTLTVDPAVKTTLPSGSVVLPETCCSTDAFCGGKCVDLATDAKNCGACGMVVDVMNDAKNCGGCGKACAMGQTCKSGKCT